MSYNLKDFLSFKLNINQFEELAFAGSNFSMPKKDLSNILLAEKQENQSSDIINEAIPDAYVKINEKKESPFSKIMKRISDFFKLGNGESVELDGTVPGNPLGGILGKIGAAIERFTNKGKDIREELGVKNSPQIISEYPTPADKKAHSDPSLLAEGIPQPNPNIVIPRAVGDKKHTSSYIQSTPNTTPAIGVEKIEVDGEEEYAVNKEAIARATESLTSDKTVEQQKTQEPVKTVEPIQEHDDDYVK